MAGLEAQGGALADRLRQGPLDDEQGSGQAEISALADEVAADTALSSLSAALRDPRVAQVLAGVMAGSPYLKALIRRDPARLQRILGADPAAHFADLSSQLYRDMAAAADMATAMRLVRVYKSNVALMVALADLGQVWPVMTVTETLTKCADAAVQSSVDFLFRMAGARGDIAVEAACAGSDTGYIVLGMGKYGAGELNYSSDIDLIVFYDLSRARLKPGLEPSPFFVRITRDLVRLLDERTADGYVFRTDLRLRPDAGATQVALSTDAAMIYYESFGQNWERAALIKARPVAGDIEAGEMLLAELAPFVWRRYLDYAAIADVHAMKRQIHSFRGFGSIGVAGHNVKLGPGGIREIEFFAQTQQLIAGGRQKDLRVRRTLDALLCLEARNWIRPEVRADLSAAYLELRRIEHRVQMVADEQTHELPSDQAALARFALFAGFQSTADFARHYTATLEGVQQHYQELFENAPELTGDGANMVFAGEKDDPETVAQLKKMGFTQPSEVLATVRGWHHGRYPAVRSPRARELLTEVQVSLVTALAETADPDRAFAGFDRFLAALPGSVQLFSLLKANPGLLRLVADIMGTAPRLARVLGKRPRLLDAVIDPRALAILPSATEIDAAITAEVANAPDQQDVLDRTRVVGSEQSFLIGVRVLSGSINASQAGEAYALLADRLIAALHRVVAVDLERAHGLVPGGAAAVIAMGKLGGREMTASSDLDLIVIYDFDVDASQSDGERPLAPSQYYARFTQRLVTALTAPTAEGTLYEVDLRLRPSGQKGPVATQLSGFVDYQIREAWTWEHLALTRARVVSADPELTAKVEAAIHATLVLARDRAKIAADVREMRARIAADKGTDNIWNLKQVRGGLVDLEFIAQYLQLVSASAHPEVLDQNTCVAFQKLGEAGCLDPGDAEALIASTRLIHDLTQVLRLCQDGIFDPPVAPKGLKELAARAGDCPSFEALELKLKDILAKNHARFERLVV
ncbi:MAG: bifunctional [glutamate--ammonia ligase]-adenylyl-L-tyrosine phosphorylase/[glutamate--ammonia-ligase] adenylyltransferase [Hyphomicrobium sp.]|nr:bifunctional [glutamate--ammonia ligase]-adenylyl-L-tyrosine phosphorylase/[glutamate--ammonia-ligase] adenylyltransferase [Hyphomicrobium sp.]PPD07223.1 MAG: bifunctional [glutamate--ammonia ligase]-adenylyl-L-tyrosine phosphorylase/[glutamate--ammonia-ligase] adenylyltransferase [Hyphomicrobium sp.]